MGIDRGYQYLQKDQACLALKELPLYKLILLQSVEMSLVQMIDWKLFRILMNFCLMIILKLIWAHLKMKRDNIWLLIKTQAEFLTLEIYNMRNILKD